MSSPSLSLDFPRAYPSLHLSGAFRSCPEDFIVHEHLGFAPTDEGEHCLLHIEKIGQNTHWVAQQVEINLGLEKKSVGYCGRKDRHAVTRQWLSIYDPKREVDINKITIDGVKILEHTRHNRKLRPGDHQANHFVIRLRELVDTSTNKLVDKIKHKDLAELIRQRLEKGLPNYFGPQRFGNNGNNLIAAESWFTQGRAPTRQQRSMVMSAARSYLFNRILAKRIAENTWSTMITGDVLVNDRPTAALWGRGRLASQAEALAIENLALEPLSEWCHGLEHCGLKQERRQLLLRPGNVSINFDDNDLVLSFALEAGSFATSVLAEVAVLRTP